MTPPVQPTPAPAEATEEPNRAAVPPEVEGFETIGAILARLLPRILAGEPVQ